MGSDGARKSPPTQKLMGRVVISEAHDFPRKLSDILISSTRIILFLATVILCPFSCSAFFHKCYIPNFINIVDPCGKKYLKQNIFTSVKNISRIMEHLQKSIFVWFPFDDIKMSDIFYKIKNFLGTSRVSIIKLPP